MTKCFVSAADYEKYWRPDADYSICDECGQATNWGRITLISSAGVHRFCSRLCMDGYQAKHPEPEADE